MSRACSSHVKQEFKRQFPGTDFSFEYTGFQKSDDGSHCGHISTWSDLTYRLALMHGCDLNEWHPDPPPDLWFEVIHETLRIRDLQAHIDVTDVDYEAIGVAPRSIYVRDCHHARHFDSLPQLSSWAGGGICHTNACSPNGHTR